MGPDPVFAFAFSFFVTVAYCRVDPKLEMATALIRDSKQPPCLLWGAGNVTSSHLGYLSSKLDRDMILGHVFPILTSRCLPCLTMISSGRSVADLDMTFGTQRGILMSRAHTLNPCKKFPFSPFQIVLVKSKTHLMSLWGRRFLYTTHFLYSISLDMVQVCTACPNGQQSSCFAWKIGEEATRFHNVCPHPLSGTEQRVSIMGTLPYVNPGGRLYGSDVDLISTVASAIGFKIEFRRERTYQDVIEAVRHLHTKDCVLCV